MIREMLFRILVLILISCCPQTTHADPATTDEQPLPELIDSQQYLPALVRALSRDTLSVQDQLAAARAAWALGLPDHARDFWAHVLEDPDLPKSERAQVLLSQSIMEFQDGNYEESRRAALRGVSEARSTGLSQELLTLAGHSLRKLGLDSLAESTYSQALPLGSSPARNEALLSLIELALARGDLQTAYNYGLQVELVSPAAMRAVEQICAIQYEKGQLRELLQLSRLAESRLTDVRTNPHLLFLRAAAAVSVGEAGEADDYLARLRSHYGPDNGWYILAKAVVELSRAAEQPDDIRVLGRAHAK